MQQSYRSRSLFRPERQAAVAGERRPAASGATNARAIDQRTQSQFRPAKAQRKVRYEDLQARVPAQSAYRTSSLLGLPMMHTPPMPAYGQYWRNW